MLDMRRFALALSFLAVLAACGGPEQKVDQTGVVPVQPTDVVENRAIREGMFTTRTIGKPLEGQPMITDLAILDLDRDGLLDVVVCDGRANTVSWIRQIKAGEFVEKDLFRDIPGPAHVEGIDIDGDDDTDLLIASMGIVIPNNDRIGAVVVLENLGTEEFRKRVLIDKVARVTDVQAGDLDGDGDLDLAVGQFGYAQGEIRWMENLGDWRFQSHPLLDLSGTIHTPVVDIDGDRDLDIVALVSQEWEDIYIFENGPAGLKPRVAYGSTNEDYGSSGISISDLDGDGDPDVLYTNGDAFDYSVPGPRPWHGVQWLENNGQGYFNFHRLGDFPGAYTPTAADLDGDGDLDVVSVSTVNDWGREDPVAMVCFEQVAPREFRKRVLAIDPPRLLALDAADIDGDGKVELVTGGFFTFPPYEKMSRVLLWDQ
jgi:hypothetical protein